MTKKDTIDFIGVGAPRCGTTWLSACLREHPEICFSDLKEVHFFDKPLMKEKGIEEYMKFFTECQTGQIRGEWTPAYFMEEQIARDIKRWFPDVKILVLLRNPVERAFSNYQYRKGRLGNMKTFREHIEDPEDRIVYAGYYGKYLKRFLKHFPSENVRVLFYEDMRSNPRSFIQSVYSFLDVNEDFIPDSLGKRVNPSMNTTFKWQGINQLDILRRKVRANRLGAFILKLLKKIGVHRLLQALMRWNTTKSKPVFSDKDTLSEDDRHYLVDLYHEDVKLLETIVGRKLSIWK